MSKQKQKRMYLEDALIVFNDILNKYREEHIAWEKTPTEVSQLLWRASRVEHGFRTIEYNRASRILDNARSSKLTPAANRGMDEIKQKWRKHYAI